MARIYRKPCRQQRFTQLVRGQISGFSTGFQHQLEENGVSFSIGRAETLSPYSFHVVMDLQEWEELKRNLDDSLTRSLGKPSIPNSCGLEPFGEGYVEED